MQGGTLTSDTMRESTVFQLHSSVISSPVTNESFSPKHMDPRMMDSQTASKYKSLRVNNQAGYSQFKVSNREKIRDKSHSVYSTVKKSSYKPSTKNTDTRTSNANMKESEEPKDPR
jgi:hypothetical protein